MGDILSEELARPFDTIEDSQAFMALLHQMIEESRQDVEHDLRQAVASQDQRREHALKLALYKMQCLAGHVDKSSRLLNDLRTLRRLLFAERSSHGSETGAGVRGAATGSD